MSHLNAPWLSLPALQHLFDLFEGEGATLRLVGGSVRDGLLGLPVNDIDLAIDRDPSWVLSLLSAHHIKAVPTGIEHGTITAVLEKRPYQITTLRVDVKTFGRKAHVAFTEDWVQDAYRRDFTINAIYANKTGHLFDPVGGVEDLKNHTVRFIGEAEGRIREDYLRILRFFRFSARFGHEPYNEEGLKGCAQYASHLPHLARERVTEEFVKLLELPSPLYALRAMEETGVLAYILHPPSWDEISALIGLEQKMDLPPSALLRLATFHSTLAQIKHHLRLSNKQLSALGFLLKNHKTVTPASFKHDAYLFGKETVFDLLLLQTARRLAASELSLAEGARFLKEMHSLFEPWAVPTLPLTGGDILSHGIQEGEKVGDLLKQVEKWWIAGDLKPGREACLQYLSTLL
jgi:poly(A) polymerase